MSDQKPPVELWIEVEPTVGQVSPEMSPEKFIKATADTLNSVSDVVKQSCTAFIAEIKNLDGAPQEISIEFGVDVGGEAGIPFITKGSIGANFKICVKWG